MTLETFAEEMRIRVQEKAGNHYEVDLVLLCGNNGEYQCPIFVSGQGGGRRRCGGIVD